MSEQPMKMGESHSSAVARIVIEFDDHHIAKFDMSGRLSAYMLKGAAGILSWTADDMMAATRSQEVAVVRNLPPGLRT